MFTATGSATYSATSSGTGSGSGNTEIDAVNAANSAANSAAQDGIATILNTIVSNTTLLLLEKNYNSYANNIKTFNYYWDKYPDLFGRIQIVDTDIDENGNPTSDNKIIIENNIKYLNEYYNKGYRLFVGFNISSTLTEVLPWFKDVGIEAKGISMLSTSSTLNIPKPIYRLRTNTNNMVNALDYIFTDASKIYYVYSEEQLTTLTLLKYLEELYPNKIISYPVKSDSSNLTLLNIKELYKDLDKKSKTLMYLFINSQRKDFVNLFNDSYPMPTSTYDIFNLTPQINETSKNALVNKYNHLDNISFSTSKFFRDGLDNLNTNFSTYVPNTLLLINKLAVNGNVTTLSSHNSILEFNENNDIKYYTFLNTIYSKDDKGNYYYKEDFYSVYDPIVGKQIFYLNN